MQHILRIMLACNQENLEIIHIFLYHYSNQNKLYTGNAIQSYICFFWQGTNANVDG